MNPLNLIFADTQEEEHPSFFSSLQNFVSTENLWKKLYKPLNYISNYISENTEEISPTNYAFTNFYNYINTPPAHIISPPQLCFLLLASYLFLPWAATVNACTPLKMLYTFQRYY